MKKYQCIITGVGGQGTMMLGQFLKQAAIYHDNVSVLGTESRGASQREGSVDATVRYAVLDEGESIDERRALYSVLIPKGEADLALSLEACEILQAMKYISEKTTVVINSYRIPPRASVVQGTPYPVVSDVVALLHRATRDVRVIDASSASKEHFGDFSMVAEIFLGIAAGSGKLPVTPEDVRNVIKERHRVPDRGLKAFQLGLDFMEGK